MLLQWLQALSQIWYMALHVVQTGAFPKPLTAQQEMEAWVAYREGGDLKARDRLVEHNLRLVAHVVRKYYGTAREQEDLISIGTIGLMKAVATFDYTKGTRLATYAARCIENEILMYFRASKRTQQEMSMSEPIDVDKEGNPLTLLDVLVGEDSLEEDTATKWNAARLKRYMQECLTAREREILERRYGLVGEGMTQREVAKLYGISRSYVSRIETKALSKLRCRYEQGDRPRKPIDD
ncbi:MAG: sigma-70 family RNA polymerase sigma factor [Ruminococcaceae bacterium]|nr:sigma-70 family RNA polymerase sigma factor [Oscillospiraceae bacterium]MBQ2780188.1 RNA polymerase sporulation sigma factor SigK [Clostridia bacterium]